MAFHPSSGLLISCRALLEHVWQVIVSVAEAIGADIYDWDSTLHSLSERAACVAYDGVHPSLQCGLQVRCAANVCEIAHMSRVRLQLADMIVSDLRGNLTPKFYESTLSVGSHACAAATPMDWSHVTLRMYASAGLYNLRWFMRGSDRIGVSSSDPAAVSISQPAALTPKFLLSIPLLLLHLSHAPNFTSCSASPLSMFTSARARVCISESDDWQGEEKGEVGWQFCTKVSDEQEVVLRCSASPTAGAFDCVRLRPIFLFLSI